MRFMIPIHEGGLGLAILQSVRPKLLNSLARWLLLSVRAFLNDSSAPSAILSTDCGIPARWATLSPWLSRLTPGLS